jgi:hypothetical protein
MKQNYKDNVDKMNEIMSEKYENYCGQFKAAEREKLMEDELAKRVSENGGKELNYFLMPKRRFNGQKRSGEDHYVVPLVYARLSSNV